MKPLPLLDDNQDELDFSEPFPRSHSRSLKHGYYARDFHPEEKSDLENLSDDGLQNEVTMIRVYLRRVLENCQDIENVTDSLRLLSGLSSAANTLTRLVKAQALLEKQSQSPKHQREQEVWQALESYLTSMEADQDPPLTPEPPQPNLDRVP